MAKSKSGSPAASAAGTSLLVKAMSALTSGPTGLPGDPLQIRVDVHVSLLDAMTDTFPIARADIGSDTVPSDKPIEADSQGWGICLARFDGCLARTRPVYSFYHHQPGYTDATLDKPLSEIVVFLTKAVIEQSKGLGE